MTQRVEQEFAYVLHSRPYRDTSLLLDLFTSQFGKVPAIARSARGYRSRFKGRLQLFCPLNVSWVGKGELVTLQMVEAQGCHSTGLHGRVLFTGFYLNELLLRLLHRFDPHPETLQRYHLTIASLQTLDAPELERSLRLFEKYLLIDLGYGFALNCETPTQIPIEEHQFYKFMPERGLSRVADRERNSEYVFSGASILALHHDNLVDKITLHDAKRLLRMALQHLLGNKPLKSRELFMGLTSKPTQNNWDLNTVQK